jgi:HD-like signal output (HDOD) protein
MEARAVVLPSVVHDPISPADVARRIVRQADAISPSPSLLRLEAYLRHGDTGAKQLGRLIEASPALAARVLRLANSAFYGSSEQVVSLRRAVVLLGDTVLRQLVLTSLITSRRATNRTPCQMLAAARLMGDAVRSAVVSRTLAEASGLASPDDAFSAGLLHDLGHIYLLDGADDRYASYLLGTSRYTDGLVQELILSGTTHTDVGAAFAEEWSLPVAIRDVLREHHHVEPHVLSVIVRVSDWLVRELNTTNFEDPNAFSDQAAAGLASVGLGREDWEARAPSVRAGWADLLTLFDATAGSA